MSDIVPWEYRTKTIKQLIKELQSFEEQDLIVMVTSGDGKLLNCTMSCDIRWPDLLVVRGGLHGQRRLSRGRCEPHLE